MRLLGRLHLKSGGYSVRPLAIDMGVFVGWRLDEQGVEELSKSGFRSIVNLARVGEPGQILAPDIEASFARSFEVEHAHLSVGHFPRREQFEQLCQLIDELPRPVYLHSTGGERALALGVAYVARRRGWSGQRALREARSRVITLRSEFLKDFLLEVVESR